MRILPPPPPSLSLSLSLHPQDTGWRGVCCHKGLVANLLFLLLMVAGIILGEVLFPFEGFHGNGDAIRNDTACLNNIGGIVTLMFIFRLSLLSFIMATTVCVCVHVCVDCVSFSFVVTCRLCECSYAASCRLVWVHRWDHQLGCHRDVVHSSPFSSRNVSTTKHTHTHTHPTNQPTNHPPPPPPPPPHTHTHTQWCYSPAVQGNS